VSVTNSLATRFPAVAAQLDPELNDGLTADRIVAASQRKVWRRCAAEPDHIWRATLANRTGAGSGCPSCAISGYKPGLPGFVYLLARRDGQPQRKVGITNVPSERLATHRRNGWQVWELMPIAAQQIQHEASSVLKHALARRVDQVGLVDQDELVHRSASGFQPITAYTSASESIGNSSYAHVSVYPSKRSSTVSVRR
jgi:hypothetical protein